MSTKHILVVRENENFFFVLFYKATDLSDDDKNKAYQRINENLDPFFQELGTKFQDPLPGS